MSSFEGPYPLTAQFIDVYVEDKTGNYALGAVHNQTFFVKYVGRSDTNLNQRLKTHIEEGYAYFEFAYSDNPVSAYEKECADYHAFKETHGLDNKIHPDKPENAPASLKCPICGQ
jgi:hypothetical protein